MDSRKLNIISIILWAAIALFLTGALVYGITSGGIIGHRGVTLQKQEIVDAEGLDSIIMDFTSENIIVAAAKANEIKIVESSGRNLRTSEKFTAVRDGNTLTIKQGKKRLFMNFFSLGDIQRKIEIFIPESYAGDMITSLSSGNVNLEGNFAFSSIKSEITSGNFTAEGAITAKEASIASTSGNIKIGKLDTGSYEVSSTSGNVGLGSLTGSGEVKGSSGNIKISYVDIAEYSSVKTTSGNISLILPKDLSFEFEGFTSSGNINADFAVTYENDKKLARAQVGSGPYKKLTAGVSSGNITVNRE
ncbi:MAG: DUF4097 family beta strand repeat-containing protein [Clostridiaceae bacterium]